MGHIKEHLPQQNFSTTFGSTMALIHTAGLALASCSAIIYTWPAFLREKKTHLKFLNPSKLFLGCLYSNRNQLKVMLRTSKGKRHQLNLASAPINIKTSKRSVGAPR